MKYPTLTEVNEAFPFEVQEWHENLPIPSTEEERAVMDRIFERMHDILNDNDW
jgi:hypothetical protein